MISNITSYRDGGSIGVLFNFIPPEFGEFRYKEVVRDLRAPDRLGDYWVGHPSDYPFSVKLEPGHPLIAFTEKQIESYIAGKQEWQRDFSKTIYRFEISSVDWHAKATKEHSKWKYVVQAEREGLDMEGLITLIDGYSEFAGAPGATYYDNLNPGTSELTIKRILV